MRCGLWDEWLRGKKISGILFAFGWEQWAIFIAVADEMCIYLFYGCFLCRGKNKIVARYWFKPQ